MEWKPGHVWTSVDGLSEDRYIRIRAGQRWKYVNLETGLKAEFRIESIQNGEVSLKPDNFDEASAIVLEDCKLKDGTVKKLCPLKVKDGLFYVHEAWDVWANNFISNEV